MHEKLCYNLMELGFGPSGLGGNLHIKSRVFLTVFAANLAVCALFAALGLQSLQQEHARDAIEQASSRSAYLSARTESVLKSLFKRAQGDVPWILSQGVASRGSNSWQLNFQKGNADRALLGKKLDRAAKNGLFSVYQLSDTETLFVHQAMSGKMHWKVTKLVPELLNLTLDFDESQMSVLLNESDEIIGMSKLRSQKVFPGFVRAPVGSSEVKKSDVQFAVSKVEIAGSNLKALVVFQRSALTAQQQLQLWIQLIVIFLIGLVLAFWLRNIVDDVNTSLSIEEVPELPDLPEEAIEAAPASLEPEKAEPEAVVIQPIDINDEIRMAMKFFTNHIKSPVVSMLGQSRLLRDNPLTERAANQAQKLESDARLTREVLDLYSLFSWAEEFEKEQVVDLASLFGHFKYHFKQEFDQDQLEIHSDAINGFYVFGSESHMRRAFEYTLQALRLDTRIRLEWRAEKVDRQVVIEVIDHNGVIGEEQWGFIGKPWAELKGRPKELSLALAALLGSVTYFGGKGEFARTADGFLLRMSMEAMSEEKFTEHQEIAREKIQSRIEEQMNQGELDKPPTAPPAMAVAGAPSVPPPTAPPPSTMDAGADIGFDDVSEDATVVMAQAPSQFTPQNLNDIVGSEMPDMAFEDAGRKQVDSYRVAIRRPRLRDKV